MAQGRLECAYLVGEDCLEQWGKLGVGHLSLCDLEH
jgi:hypothetical protein